MFHQRLTYIMGPLNMNQTLGPRKRDRLRIMAEILSIATHDKKKTHIIRTCNLSSKMFQRYADTLLNKGLISLVNDSGGAFYKTTEKGQDFIKRYEKINEILL